ncbi:triosephosphate isomerase [Gurleya vavrai]
MIIANWKCNFCSNQLTRVSHLNPIKNLDVFIACPSIYIPRVRHTLPDYFGISAQDCSEKESGPYTGEISAEMLVENKCTQVIIGHSERRHIFGCSDEKIMQKIKNAVNARLNVVLCVGEKEGDSANEIIKNQMEVLNGFENIDIAYEPVYAIGTGKVPSDETIIERCRYIRNIMDKKSIKGRILYGGSVTEENIKNIWHISGVDGVLIGGASLKKDFFGIYNYILENNK